MNSPQNSARLNEFENLPFGEKFCPLMIEIHHANGTWSRPSLVPSDRITVSPAAKGLHYGLEAFEGMRAFRTEQGLALFRPDRHIARMARSAFAVGLPPLPESEFMNALRELVHACEPLLPVFPGSLYLRPFIMGTNPKLGVGVSNEALFLILASPFGFKMDPSRPKATSAWVCTEYVRAFPGGTGNVKVAGNYAASLRALMRARELGYENVLFLDALERRWLEEFSGMNFFCVREGVLTTPPLRETILPGVTRESLLRLAADAGIPTAEIPISIEELNEGVASGKISEVLACGTGSAVVAVTELGTSSRLRIGNGTPGPVTIRLSQALFAAQFGMRIAGSPSGPADPDNWRVRV